MTLEQAIDRYSNNAEYERRNGSLHGCMEFRQLAEWLKDYKRLLEQEPCDDAISRTMPPVTQKSGKWIDINGIYAECSSCNEEIYITGDFKYCPNCGAKMESEDK